MELILQARELTKEFHVRGRGTFTAVDRVSFALGRGESLGVVGQSGCGKTTLARMLCRLMAPTSGEILLHGENVTHARGKELCGVYRRMQMVFQSPADSFDPRRTLGGSIVESLANWGVPKGECTARLQALLECCGLEAEVAGRYPGAVSGGQCQRAAIARALAAEPEILICDEATSALDVTVQQQIMALLTELKKERQLSFLFISHNLALVQAFCDRVLVMEAGCVVEEGTPDEVIFAPRTEAARRLVDAVV